MKLNKFCYIAIYQHPKTSNYSVGPFLAEITLSNRGRKLLQIFLTKPFLIDGHARFKEALSPSTMLWCDLQVFPSMCAHKLKAKRFKPSSCGGQKSESQKAHIGNQPVMDSAYRVCRLFVLLQDVIWFLSDILDPCKNFSLQNSCQRQRLACSPVQTKTGAQLLSALSYDPKLLFWD